MTKDNGGPAFPSHGSMGEVVQEGMTLRDYFAAKAMQGLLSNANGDGAYLQQLAGGLAEHAYLQADAMLTERSKP